MLRVTFEIVPFGIEDHPNRREIGKLELGLQCVSPEGVGTYISRLYVDERGPRDVDPVVNFEHLRSDGAYSLVAQALLKHLGASDESA